jgi:hypothetical protein
MALIHIARDHKPLGTITEDELRDGIFSGKYVATDLVWREGMAEWKPLSEMASQWGMETPAPALVPVVKTEPVSPEAESGTEPAWEDRERLGIFPAITRTVSAVLMRPAETFAAMKRAGGLADPLLYFVLVSTAMFAVSTLYHLLALHFDPMVAKFLTALLPAYSKSQITVMMLGQVLLSPAYNVLVAFIIAGGTHLCLMMIRGANFPFETTFRFCCYAFASISPLMLIPVFGWLAWLIWGSYISIVGLREAQKISAWKATWGLSLPVLICCGIPLLLGAFGLSMILAKAGLLQAQ